MDPRDYAGLGDFNLIPTKLLSMSQIALETASDEWFADLNDDGLPGVAVGRLPVRTIAQAEAMVRKIIAYDTPTPGTWTTEVTLAADDNDAANDFEGGSKAIAAGLPAGYTAHEVFHGTLGADTGGALASEVASGRLIVNYLGHGSTRLWGRQGDILGNDLVASTWPRGAPLPFVIAMNCLSGFFHGIYDEESLAEALLRAPDGGAVAAWASSSLTASATQRLVSRELFRLLLQDGRLTLGEAAVRAKRVVAQRDVRRSWIFFGDPATRLMGVTPGADAVRLLDSLDAADAVTTDPAADQGARDTIRQVRLADIDGDGRADLLAYRPETGAWQAWTALGSFLRGGRWPAHVDVRAARFNPGRLADLLLYDAATGGWSQLVNDGQSFVTTTGMGLPDADLQLADIDGDGRDDMLLYQPATGAWLLGLNDAHGGFTVTSGRWAGGLTVRLADVDGDGRAAIFTYDRTTGRWRLYDRPDAVPVREGRTARGWEIAVARLDADSRADLLLSDPSTGRWETWVSPVRGRFAIARTGAWRPGRVVQLADLTGTGIDAAFLYDPQTGAWTVESLTAGAAPAAGGAGPRGADLAVGDIDGDGLTEIYLYQPVTGDVVLVDAAPDGQVTLGRATWPSGWTLSGSQSIAPIALARLQSTAAWPISTPRLYVIDRRDVANAIVTLGMPQQATIAPPRLRRQDAAAGDAVAATVASVQTASAVAPVDRAEVPTLTAAASSAAPGSEAAPSPAAPDSSALTAAPASSESRPFASTPVHAWASAGPWAADGGTPAAAPTSLEPASETPDGPRATGESPDPGATTLTATDLTGDAAMLHGAAAHAPDGSRGGFLWGTDDRPATPTATAAPDGAGAFKSTLDGLRADTIYYFRTIVETPESGRLLGEVMHFRTSSAVPPAR